MCSIYPHNILALKRLHHTFSQSHSAIFTLVSDEFEFSFGLMKLCRLWNCDGFGLLCHVDREKYKHERKYADKTSHAHFHNGRGRGYFSAGN